MREDPKPATFTKASLPFGWLGNMSPYPLWHEGVLYRTAEALFQALRFDDVRIRREIRDQKSPMGAKFVAKHYAEKMIVKPKSDLDLANMEFVLRLKVKQCPDLAAMLVDTGDAPLIEDVTKRGNKGNNCFWGAMLVDGTWIGENVLGNIWMRIRADLKKELK